ESGGVARADGTVGSRPRDTGAGLRVRAGIHGAPVCRVGPGRAHGRSARVADDASPARTSAAEIARQQPQLPPGMDRRAARRAYGQADEAIGRSLRDDLRTPARAATRGHSRGYRDVRVRPLAHARRAATPPAGPPSHTAQTLG